MTGKTKENGIRVHIREMHQSHVSEVFEIEQLSFEYGWSERDFFDCLSLWEDYVCLAAMQDETIVGFLVYQKCPKHFHLINFAIHPRFRRMGAGTQMVTRFIRHLSRHHRSYITLEVRETNLIALKFFHHQQFRATGEILQGFYKDTGEDAFVVEYRPNGVYVRMCSTNIKNRITQYDQEGIF